MSLTLMAIMVGEPEGFVGRPEPANEGGGSEEDGIDEGKPKSSSSITTSEKIEQPGKHVTNVQRHMH